LKDLQATPVMGNILKRFFKVTNQGSDEWFWKTFDQPQREEQGRRSYLRQKMILRFVSRGESDVGDLWDRMVLKKVEYKGGRSGFRRLLKELEKAEEIRQSPLARALRRAPNDEAREQIYSGWLQANPEQAVSEEEE